MTHPLLTALTTAGEMSRTVARNLRSQSYGAFDLGSNMAILADALVTDQTGHRMISDRNTINDRDYSRAQRDAAKARTAQRTEISTTLADLPSDWRRLVIDALADGTGPQAAERLQAAADTIGADLPAAMIAVSPPAYAAVTA